MASEARPRDAVPDAYVPELDGIRGVAILAVIAVHFVATIFEQPQNLVERIAGKITGYGMWGVDLFFVLSGYLITGILWDSRPSPRYFKAFYMRRTLRIFPLYYGILLSHVLLAISVPFLAIAAVWYGGRALGWGPAASLPTEARIHARQKHIKLVRWAFPIWLYVSITGVVVYAMLYHLWPSTDVYPTLNAVVP